MRKIQMMRCIGPGARAALAGLVAAGALLAVPLLGARSASAQPTDAARPDGEPPRQIAVKILGMSCPFCAYGVEQKLEKLEGVEELDVALESGVATLTMEEGADVPNEDLKKTVEEAGFEAAAIVRNFESEHEDWNPDRLPGRALGGSASS